MSRVIEILGQCALVTLVAIGTGCAADAGEETLAVGVKSTPINGGTEVDAATNATMPYSSIIYFATTTNDLCTATKIRQSATRDTYLTAAHCVPGPGVTPGWPIRMGNGLNGNRPPNPQPVQPRIKELYRHPSFDVDPTSDTSPTNLSYDIAVFTLDRNATNPVVPPEILGIPALPANPDVEAHHVAAAETFVLTGYGCNSQTPALDGHKQYVLVTTNNQGNLTTSEAIHFLRSSGIPSGCQGDSGGPLMELVSGQARISGIVSYGQGNETRYTRAANVRRWVESPQKLNSMVNNELGFFLNHDNLNCLTEGVLAIVTTGICYGKDQPTDVQYWKLVLSPDQTSYQIKNTLDGKCIFANSGTAGRGTCNSNDTSGSWTFPVSGTGRQIRNVQTGKCLALDPTGTAPVTCDSSAKNQRWSFFP